MDKIPASVYSKEYYLSDNFGQPDSFSEYKAFLKGNKPPRIYLKALKIAGLRKNLKNKIVLDMGCGRGELAIYLGRNGYESVGMDYSKDSIDLCQQALLNESANVKKRVSFIRSFSDRIPLGSNTVAIVFMLDLVEHLATEQLAGTLTEAYRVLNKGGRLILHTNNLFFEKYIKNLLILSYVGIKFFKEPHKYINKIRNPYEFMHINIMRPQKVDKLLTQVGFKSQIYLTKPKSKKELYHLMNYSSKTIKWLNTNIAWFISNSFLATYFSPTFWVSAVKR